jgi:hypothetical protein
MAGAEGHRIVQALSAYRAEKAFGICGARHKWIRRHLLDE